MTIAVCDDDALFLNHFQNDLTHTFESYQFHSFYIHLFTNGCDLLNQFENNPLDVLFIDMHLPDIDGFTIARQIQQTHENIRIVIITSDFDYAIEGYKLGALRFLPKDNVQKLLPETVRTILHTLNEQEVTVTLSVSGKPVTFPLKKVMYIESFHHVMVYHLKDGSSIESSGSLDNLEEKYAPYHFIRIQKSYIINLKYSEGFDSGKLIMSDGIILPISRSKMISVRHSYIKYHGEY